MQLIDTHAHLDDDAFASDRDETLARADAVGLSAIVTIGTTVGTSRTAVEFTDRYPHVFAAVGIQPNHVAQAGSDDWEIIRKLAARPKVVAIGETGLDRYWDYAPFDQQVEYFQKHIELARETDLPFIVHCRDAAADVIAQLRQAAEVGPLRGVLHAFSADSATASICLELGLHISFAGMLTYKKNEGLRAVAAQVPLDRLVVETDCPYLAPTPKRGKRNEPAYVVHTLRCLAEIHGMSEEEMARMTTQNARRLFQLPDHNDAPESANT